MVKRNASTFLYLTVVLLIIASLSEANGHFQEHKHKHHEKHSFKTFTHVECHTVKGEGRAVKPLPTRHSTHKIHREVDVIVTKRKTITITPAARTIVSTLTQTIPTTSTNLAVTDTLTVPFTPTVTTTTTLTTTETAIVDGGSTTITSTSSIITPTPAGYTALPDQVSSAGNTPAYRRALPTSSPDSGSLIARHREKHHEGFCDKKGEPLRPKYVKCKKVLKVVEFETKTITRRHPKTVTARPRIHRATQTVQTTSTKIVALPNVSVTVTSTYAPATETDTATSTTTTTSTTITTSTAVATATSYAACSPEKFVDKINGNYITGGSGSYNQNISNRPTKEECCNLCQTTPQCVFFAFSQSGNGQCLTFTPNTPGVCPSSYTLYTTTGSSLASAFAIGNGVCGGYRSSSSPPP